jgi:hypothetical protein
MKFRIVEFKNGKFGLERHRGPDSFTSGWWENVDKNLKVDLLYRFNSKSEAMGVIDNHIVKETFEEIEV